MNWEQICALIGVNITLASITIGFVIWAVNKLHSDIGSMNARLDGHASRIDQLYSIIVDLLKK